MPKLVIKASAIAGQGCFAAEAVACGTLVARYTGEIIAADEAYRREADCSRNGIYTFWIDDDHAIDAYYHSGAARLINHSCEPNCDFHIADDHVAILATRDILAGEELTIDYCFAPEGPPVVCRCGSATCRGTINTTGD